MRQRVIIAMALALEPELVIMDEPTTALDVVVQREILQEIEALQRDLGFAVLFITHDLSLLIEFADRIGIMYAGELVETSPAAVAASSRRSIRIRIGLMRSFPPLTGPLERHAGHPGLAAGPCEPAGRLPLPSALPALRARRRRALRAPDDRKAAATRGRAGAPGRLPPGREPMSTLEVQDLTKRFANRLPWPSTYASTTSSFGRERSRHSSARAGAGRAPLRA